uniref:Uncharacterized protein n=1 Tax=viral metagenome TaxID=1070528 RepID=A0A6C0EU50_9ZZZZ
MEIEYFSDNNYKYSTALMFSYIKLRKPEKNKININSLDFNLNYNCWENNVKPLDVMNDIKNVKYKEEVKRIKNAEIKYPIIVDLNYNIIDGMHRYVRHILEKKEKINVYIFNKNIMKKFILCKKNEPIIYTLHDIIELYHKNII